MRWLLAEADDSRPVWFTFAALVSVIGGLALYIAVFIRSGEYPFEEWKLTQFHASYLEYGFIKRGVIGTIFLFIFEFLDLERTEKIISVVIFDGVLFFFFVWLLRHVLFRAGADRNWALVFAILLVMSPLGLSQWSFDVGRLDHLNFILFLFCAFALHHQRPALSGLLAGLCVLIHEAFAVYAIPGLIFIEMALARSRKENVSTRSLALIASPSLLAFLLVAIWGNIEDPADLQKLATHYDGFEVWSRGFLEPSLTLGVPGYLVVAAYLALIYALFFRFFVEVGGRCAATLLLVVPLLLFIAGKDYARWLHIIFISFFIVLNSTQGLLPRSRTPFGRLEKVCFLLLCIPLGPIGITTALPFVPYFGGLLFKG
ncbi:MAG: hypothetical protein ACOVOA_09490 [Allorhizobium sp.]